MVHRVNRASRRPISPVQQSATTQDGQASGTLTSYAVGVDGTIEGTFSNGQTSALGQVAVASFANTEGLLRTGDNNYQATAGSGSAQIGVAGTGGRGVITGGSVEGSNVDVAAEFAKMIVAQQALPGECKDGKRLWIQISQTTIPEWSQRNRTRHVDEDLMRGRRVSLR